MILKINFDWNNSLFYADSQFRKPLNFKVREICERPLVSSTKRFKSIENIHNTATPDDGNSVNDDKVGIA